jgi:1-pyrroline-5-carboxylate dehydrogenase
MGNRVTVKVDSRVSAVFQEFLNLMLKCGLPENDVSLIHTNGENMELLLGNPNLRMTQFTGSSRVAEHLSKKLHGRIKIEDAGYNWKITGPDVIDLDYVAYICDRDSFSLSGQKCSAQRILFTHENWVKQGLIEQFVNKAKERRFESLTIVPVFTWTNQKLNDQLNKLKSITGAKILAGGKPVSEKNNVPSTYGLFEPTIIQIPFNQVEPNFKTITTEIFGPISIVVEYKDSELDKILALFEKMDHHLTAGVVSNDARFLTKVLGNSLNGVTYAGIKARTTGAPQNHWFGPTGDPRGAGIGTIEAIKYVWSTHREIIMDTWYMDERNLKGKS